MAARALAHRRLRQGFAVLMFALVATGAVARTAASDRPIGNAVTHRNALATETFIPPQETNPVAQSRTFAIPHAAMHDAPNAIDRRFKAYTRGLGGVRKASVEAVATAARDVLVALVPDRAALVAPAYAGVHFPHAVRNGRPGGRSIGRAVADALGSVR